MTPQVRIATGSQDVFDALCATLTDAGFGYPIERERLTDAKAAYDWLQKDERTLLVLDGYLPDTKGGSEDRSGGAHALELLHEVRESAINTPILVIMQGALPDLESECIPENRAIALPLDKLQRYRAKVLGPFMAMLMDQPMVGNRGVCAVPGTFRVIEVDFESKRSVCWLGFDDKPDLRIGWRETKQLRNVRNAASVFSDMDVYSQRGWMGKVRLGGEAVFGRHVMDAVGTGLFSHIERAAGGLAELSFRYIISDPALYPAPFEGSIRGVEDSQDGRFVLLSAPVVRRLASPLVIRASRHRTAGLPTPARILFVRSQMSEHPDGATLEDELTVLDKTLSFSRLDSIDRELEDMKALAQSLGPGRIVLEWLDLSKFQRDGAASALRNKLSSQKYDLLHYAGHAWSSGMGGRDENLLVLPGPQQGQAVGFPIDELADLAARTEAWFVYLSACRGSTTRSVQSFVAQGVPHALGFRCNVEDERAAAFAATFYSSLFKAQSLCRSFHEACATARREMETEEESPIWVTPIMLAQSPDWARR
jgi:hypothetical protein